MDSRANPLSTVMNVQASHFSKAQINRNSHVRKLMPRLNRNHKFRPGMNYGYPGREGGKGVAESRVALEIAGKCSRFR